MIFCDWPDLSVHRAEKASVKREPSLKMFATSIALNSSILALSFGL